MELKVKRIQFHEDRHINLQIILQSFYFVERDYLIYIVKLLILSSFNSFNYYHFNILACIILKVCILKGDFITWVQIKIYLPFIKDYYAFKRRDACDDDLNDAIFYKNAH